MQLTRRLDTNHDMTFGKGLANFAVNAESVRINVETKLLVLLGEWFLDTTLGVDYLGKIAQKPPDFAYLQSVVKATILATDGVQSIESFDMTFSQSSRIVSITASILTIYSTIPVPVQVNS